MNCVLNSPNYNRFRCLNLVSSIRDNASEGTLDFESNGRLSS